MSVVPPRHLQVPMAPERVLQCMLLAMRGPGLAVYLGGASTYTGWWLRGAMIAIAICNGAMQPRMHLGTETPKFRLNLTTDSI